ncbi:hypothetical protein BOSE127_30182 [Bosea sp. 127]|nr:hypothetical protein BOSE7B_20168 [Bosea sp. 7B]VXC65052.1 hypothetical protein BOSE127_30182 [Bosea sp. 127]
MRQNFKGMLATLPDPTLRTGTEH